MRLTQYPSPSFGPRRDGAQPDIVVLHYTAMKNADVALERLCDPDIKVSAHYLIARDGEVFQLVDEGERAWHAGGGSWGAVTDINSRSIGIEIDNTGAQPFSEPQMAALEILLRGIMTRWAIPPDRVIAHSDMAPTRKSDPGARFEWMRLARQGLSVWPEQIPADDLDLSSFRNFADTFGYRIDVNEDVLLRAFRLRFRPHATGPIDAIDLQLIWSLAQRYPVDRTELSA